MIDIFKSQDTDTIYLGTISSSFSEDYRYTESNGKFTIYRQNSDIIDVKEVHYSEFVGKELNSNIVFNSSAELKNYLDKIFTPKQTYCVLPVITNVSEKYFGFNSTTSIEIEGEFLDQINGANLIGTIGNSSVSNLQILSHRKITLDVISDSIPDTYTLELKGICGDVSVNNIQVLSITTTIPDNNVSSPALWRKSNSNNNVTLGLGLFESQNSTGNGWNDHAYFGPFNSNSRIDYEFTVDRLNGNSNAYCFIRFNSSTNPSTSGNPRLYISNGNTLYVYNNSGSQSTHTLSQNDVIKISFTINSMEVIKNGTSIYFDNQGYNLNNMFATFTAYRVFRATNIKAKVF